MNIKISQDVLVNKNIYLPASPGKPGSPLLPFKPSRAPQTPSRPKINIVLTSNFIL
jgi:hypothetical protein